MRRALIVKLGAIGDVVMAIPAAKALHDEGYAIDWMCGEAVASLLRLYAWINVLPVSERALLREGKLSTLRTLMKAWKQLPHRRYDVCATLYYDKRYRLLTLPVRAKRAIVLSAEDRRYKLLHGRHHTDEYARILLGREDGETTQQLSPLRAEGLPLAPSPKQQGVRRVVLAPGGARNLLRDDALRRWPVENYVVLTSELSKQGIETVLAGGPEDAWVSAVFAGLTTHDLIGKLTLVETLALMDSAEVTVTHDTGPLHLAGLTRTAIVTIFGPTDPRGRLPQVPNSVALWGGEGFACRPCYDGRDYAPCTHNGCMEQVSPEMVLAEIRCALEAADSGEQRAPRIVTPEHTPLVQIARTEMQA